MTCPNCGAPIEENALRCEYCGRENEAVAHAAHRAGISAIHRDTDHKMNAPARELHRGARGLFTSARWLVILFVVAALVALGWSVLRPRLEARSQERHLTHLETLYQEGDLSGIAAYLEDMDDSYRAVYDKYRILSDLQERLDYVREDLPGTLSLIADYPPSIDLIDFDLDYLFSVLNECQALEDAGYVYGEETAVTALRKEATDILHELGLDDAMIQQGQAIARQEEPDYSPLHTLDYPFITGVAP